MLRFGTRISIERDHQPKPHQALLHLSVSTCMFTFFVYCNSKFLRASYFNPNKKFLKVKTRSNTLRDTEKWGTVSLELEMFYSIVPGSYLHNYLSACLAAAKGFQPALQLQRASSLPCSYKGLPTCLAAAKGFQPALQLQRAFSLPCTCYYFSVAIDQRAMGSGTSTTDTRWPSRHYTINLFLVP